MTALITVFNMSFDFVLGAINSGAGMLLAISIFDFPLLGWAAAGGVVWGVVSLFGRDDEDDEEEEPIILEDDFIPKSEFTYENVIEMQDEMKRYEPIYQKQLAKKAANLRKKKARAAVRNYQRLKERGKLDD